MRFCTFWVIEHNQPIIRGPSSSSTYFNIRRSLDLKNNKLNPLQLGKDGCSKDFMKTADKALPLSNGLKRHEHSSRLGPEENNRPFPNILIIIPISDM